MVADHRNRHAPTHDQVLDDPSAEQTDTVRPSGGRPPHQLSLENLHELAVRLRRGLRYHVAAGLLTVAEANDMMARVDGLIAQRSRPGNNGRAGGIAAVPPVTPHGAPRNAVTRHGHSGTHHARNRTDSCA